MSLPRATARRSGATVVLESPPPSPDALEQRRFERDRAQALTVIAIIAAPIAAFGITDALLAKSALLLAIMWSVRAATLAGIFMLWRALRRTATRARFERLLFGAQLLGVALAVAVHIGRGPNTLIMTRFELLSVVIYYLMIPGRSRVQAVPAVALSVSSLAFVVFWHVGVSGPEMVSHVVCFVLANVLGLLVGRHRQDTASEEDEAWRALAVAHERLRNTVDELRTLRSVVPICPHCHKVRDSSHAWQQLEAYVSARNGVEFSPILCPSCLVGEFGAVLDRAPATR